MYCLLVPFHRRSFFCKEAPTTGAEKFRLTDNVRSELEIKALDGDMESAERLYKYYLYCDFDEDKTQHWLKIAEENGSEDARSYLQDGHR